MKEIEILVTYDNKKEEVLSILEKYEFIGEKEIYDTYFVDPLRDNLKPEANLRINEILRVRRKGKGCLLTYKKNHFRGNRWFYSDEYETEVNSYEMMEDIIKRLGLEEQIVVHNKRRTYKHKDFNIELEEVENLGLFLEVEKVVADDTADLDAVKNEVRAFIKSLGLTNVRELDLGKNQLMLMKKLGREDLDIYIHD